MVTKQSEVSANNAVSQSQKSEGAYAPKEDGKIWRVLTLDGGGIYGLFSVLMLKQLCLADERFLRHDDATLFAGTSAGALSALALARAENPRDVILSGQLERLFCDARLYGHSLSLTALTSLYGLTSWTGRKDSQDLLQSYFGDITLGDLHHNVMITTFDMYGDPRAKDQKWKPRMFYNFPETEANRNLLVRQIAYGATSPVQWRHVYDGITDGGISMDNPAMPAITKVLRYEREWDPVQNRRALDQEIADNLHNYFPLKRMRLLSLGVGNKVPFYFKPDFDLGYLTFNLVPTNIQEKFYYPPLIYMMLSPQVETTNYQAQVLLGDSFHRLDPHVIGSPVPPILAAMYLCRFTMARKFIAERIKQAIYTEDAQQDLRSAQNWLQKYWWREDDPKN